MAAAVETLYLARCELGRECTVVPIDPASVRLPDYNKPRATIIERKPRAWLFDARRSSLGELLCSPGAAAWGRTPEEAKQAASDLLRQNAAALKAELRMSALYQQARMKRV